ncbi:MAG: DinB family protein [Armatimonadetes bacterium]|nr:DinB family protein [Armatimonadota bacterium]
MTRDDLLGVWEPLLANLENLFKVIPDEPANLREPLWQGTFETADGPKDEAAMPMGQLMAHLVVACHEVPLVLCGQGSFDQVREVSTALATATVPELRAALAERVPKTIALLQAADDADLAVERDLPLGRLTGGQAWGRAALHVMHHKGQLSVLARIAGVRPGRFI